MSYYDATGASTSWYKVDFYDTTNSVASALSTAFQSGEFRGYCTVDDIRNATNITSSDLSDTQVCNLITFAGIQINADMNIYVEEERVAYITNTKSNEIDGTNTTFYTRNWPIGDLNDDFSVDSSDVEVFSYDSDGTRTELTVSSVTAKTGTVELETAPAAALSKVTMTYKWCQRDVTVPDPLLKTACVLLVSFWAYSKINIGKSPRWRMGSTQIYRDMDSPEKYYDRYLRMLSRLNDRTSINQIQLIDILP